MVSSVPRARVRTFIKKRLPALRLDATTDMLIHLSCLLFLQRLATEARLKAVEDRCSVIKPAHIRAVAK
ncbi:hypothetical protein GDO78_001438, partial [Eleutherodactylus coqui]